ncbi:ABC transporter ATP-binding protein [Acholeplasma granularum]|uniref:ABC transporter ATP-binding protein n=1 Tax=Acholeplasma granularum TaxID=264635 RepID=UPI000470DE0B|nr:sn-glycerol-3-phosphate ABC transporter ATP-binding protein UgpC [Acholeplasma granularum]
MATMKLENINKIYPSGVQAVFDFNIDIKDGEFIVLVGPSGCGKSTTLRMIAGLEEISSGLLTLDDKKINDLAPKDRDISMVFQNYALYAHMTVYHNMAFSLVLRKEKAEIIHERVMWAADILGLTPYLNRKPANLSGGQRQRVAVGRSIVRNPKVFLFDEPLSNLDAKLRGIMRKELKLLHTRLGSTMIYVTHDQIEALTLADRIVVMSQGYIQQIGSPTEIYTDPKNLFVANFIGTPPMNIFRTKLNDDLSFDLEGTVVDVSKVSIADNLVNFKNKEVVIGIRPEHVMIEADNGKNKGVPSVVTNYELLGASALVHFTIGGQKVISKVDERVVFKKGDKIVFNFSLDNTYFFDNETENRIYAINHDKGAQDESRD